MDSGSSFNLAYVELDRYNSIQTVSNQNLTQYNSSLNGTLISIQSNNQNLNQTTNEQNFLNNSNIYDESAKNKFNSFPMRQKKPLSSQQQTEGTHSKLKPTPKSASSLQYNQLMVLSLDELSSMVKLARTRSQEAERLKHLLRNNNWPVNHPIRKYLWKCLLQVSASSNLNSNANKENINCLNGSCPDNSTEFEYNKHLNQIFGKCNFFL